MSKKTVTRAVSWVHSQSLTLKRRASSPYINQIGKPPASAGGTHLNSNWIHSPDALSYGRVDYTVKFLGEVSVDKPKGTDVVKESIRKINFQLQIKKSSGERIPRVEIQINLDGVRIVDPATKMIMYRFPLYAISFCADDKEDKRIFSFIAKSPEATKHQCFVFLSDKLAKEITLSIGQAFDIAYRKFQEKNEREAAAKRQIAQYQKRISDLESENHALKQRLAKYESGSSVPVATYSTAAGGSMWETFSPTDAPTEVAPPLPPATLPPKLPPAVQRPRPGTSPGSVRFGLTTTVPAEMSDSEFDPRASDSPPQATAPKPAPRTSLEPKRPQMTNGAAKDPFGLDPFSDFGNDDMADAFSERLEIGSTSLGNTLDAGRDRTGSVDSNGAVVNNNNNLQGSFDPFQ